MSRCHAYSRLVLRLRVSVSSWWVFFSPYIGISLWQAHKRKHAAGKLVGHGLNARRSVIEPWDYGIDSSPGFRSPVHIANVDAIERRFAHAEHQGALLLQADIGSALNQVARQAVGDAGQCAHAAGKNNHGARGIGAAGHVSANVVIILLANLF